jgi:hypothetical protein
LTITYSIATHGMFFYNQCLNFITMGNYNGVVKTKQQMAGEYGVSRKTFQRLLLKRQIVIDRGLIFPKDQEFIYKELGRPKSIQRVPKTPKNSQ